MFARCTPVGLGTSIRTFWGHFRFLPAGVLQQQQPTNGLRFVSSASSKAFEAEDQQQRQQSRPTESSSTISSDQQRVDNFRAKPKFATAIRDLGHQKAAYHRYLKTAPPPQHYNQRQKMRSSGDNRFSSAPFGGGQPTENRGGFNNPVAYRSAVPPSAQHGGGGGFGTPYSNNGGGSSVFGGGGSSYGGYNDYRQSSYGNGGGFGGAGLSPVDWSRATLAPIKKNIYHESAVVTARSDSEITEWLAQHQVTLTGKNVPRPVFGFDEVGFPKEMESLLFKNYQKPTVIQSISWPVAMSGSDMISIARTGSGKTLGFILPAILHTLAQSSRPAGGGPSVLVILPTRELAQQVQEVAKDYCAVMGLSSTCLFGGASKHGQASDLRRGVDLCIATPGRLLDFLENGTTNMNRCTFLVLDEADRMLDMGFEPQIRKVVSQIRPDRQTLMFSATWPKEVRTLAADFQKEPVFLNVGSLELSANHNIEQVVEVVEEHQKKDRLFQMLEKLSKQPTAKVIIFVETKRKADELTYTMRRGGWPALCIHGDKEQRERDWVLGEFRTGKTPILLATDVAARGLDVDDITHVICYDYANNSEDYVHRIGRTARRDKKGIAHTFFTPSNAPKARDLIKLLQESNQVVPPELLALTSGGYSGRGFSSGGNSVGRSRYGQSGGGGMRFGNAGGSGGYSGSRW